MRQLILFIGILIAYTFIYTGLSYFWQGVTVVPGTGKAEGGGVPVQLA